VGLLSELTAPAKREQRNKIRAETNAHLQQRRRQVYVSELLKVYRLPGVSDGLVFTIKAGPFFGTRLRKK
jgi:hypothetical protein